MSAHTRIRVLAVDLDGTVLSPEYRISDRVVAAIEAFRRSGRAVVVATGRTRPAALPWIDRIGGADGLVCFNGGFVYDGSAARSAEGEPILATRLPEDEARRFLAFARGSDLHYHAFIGERWFYERERPEVEVYERRSGLEGALVDFNRLPRLDFCKAMFLGEAEAIAAVEAPLRAAIGDGGRVVGTGKGLLELVPSGVSKSSGLDAWLERRDFGRDQVVAFGDAENDEDMISAAGIGVAMADAPDSVKAAADEVVPGVSEDGVAVWLERFLEDERVGRSAE